MKKEIFNTRDNKYNDCVVTERRWLTVSSFNQLWPTSAPYPSQFDQAMYYELDS
jgi:hypothetical protein